MLKRIGNLIYYWNYIIGAYSCGLDSCTKCVFSYAKKVPRLLNDDPFCWCGGFWESSTEGDVGNSRFCVRKPNSEGWKIAIYQRLISVKGKSCSLPFGMDVSCLWNKPNYLSNIHYTLVLSALEPNLGLVQQVVAMWVASHKGRELSWSKCNHEIFYSFVHTISKHYNHHSD